MTSQEDSALSERGTAVLAGRAGGRGCDADGTRKARKHNGHHATPSSSERHRVTGTPAHRGTATTVGSTPPAVWAFLRQRWWRRAPAAL